MQSRRVANYRHATPPPTKLRPYSTKLLAEMPSKRQKLFVEECLSNPEKSFDEVMKHHFVTTERFVNWLMEPAFRRYIKAVARALREQTHLILSIGRKRSAMFLTR